MYDVINFLVEIATEVVKRQWCEDIDTMVFCHEGGMIIVRTV